MNTEEKEFQADTLPCAKVPEQDTALRDGGAARMLG